MAARKGSKAAKTAAPAETRKRRPSKRASKRATAPDAVAGDTPGVAGIGAASKYADGDGNAVSADADDTHVRATVDGARVFQR